MREAVSTGIGETVEERESMMTMTSEAEETALEVGLDEAATVDVAEDAETEPLDTTFPVHPSPGNATS